MNRVTKLADFSQTFFVTQLEYEGTMSVKSCLIYNRMSERLINIMVIVVGIAPRPYAKHWAWAKPSVNLLQLIQLEHATPYTSTYANVWSICMWTVFASGRQLSDLGTVLDLKWAMSTISSLCARCQWIMVNNFASCQLRHYK